MLTKTELTLPELIAKKMSEKYVKSDAHFGGTFHQPAKKDEEYVNWWTQHTKKSISEGIKEMEEQAMGSHEATCPVWDNETNYDNDNTAWWDDTLDKHIGPPVVKETTTTGLDIPMGTTTGTFTVSSPGVNLGLWGTSKTTGPSVYPWGTTTTIGFEYASMTEIRKLIERIDTLEVENTEMDKELEQVKAMVKALDQVIKKLEERK